VAEALKLDPNLAEAWASAGLAAYYREHVERAESMLRRAVELNPNYAPARNWYFMLLTWVDRPDEALVQIQRAVELDPLSTVINENLAEVLELRGRFHEAHAHYRRAIMIDPFFPRPYLHFAFLNAYVFNRFVDAVPLVQRAMELDSDNAGLFGDLAILYFDLGNDDKLFETTAQATKRWPDDYTIQFPLALVKLIRLDAVGAVRHAQRAVAGDKRYEWGLAILRNADLQSGHYRAALTRYENAYPELFVQGSPRIDSLNVGVAIDLALVLQKRGDIERANRLLDTADAVIRTHHRLSWDGYSIGDVQIHSLRGDRTKALTALRDAEKSGWRGPVWRYHRDFNPNLSSIRSEPEFKAVFADIERDMAKQRARLAARPTDAPLELTDASRRQ
jgi:tetratricopeptide (TPR) repeat protein